MKLFLIFIQLDLKLVEEYRLTPTDVMGILFSASVFLKMGVEKYACCVLAVHVVALLFCTGIILPVLLPGGLREPF